jgi:uncharacterized membrane protein YeiH
VLATTINWGAWKFTGSFTGILLMAILGGIGGGVTRDVILNKIPGAFTNPAYLTLCIAFGVLGYYLAFGKGQLFREGLFQFATAFSLPWYAVIGASAAITAHLPAIGALAIAVIAPTAGRYLIDISCGVPPKQFIRVNGSSAPPCSPESSGCSATKLV